MLHDCIGLELLEGEAQSLVAVVFVVGLIFVIFDLDEVTVDGVWSEGEGDERVDGCGLGDNFEGP